MKELGSGVRNIMKYSKTYFGANPEFTDEPIFTTTINIKNANLITHFKEQGKNNKDKAFNKINQASDQVSYQVSYQVSDQVSDQVSYQADLNKTILEFCITEKSLKEILDKTGYKGRVYFKKKFINPLLEKGLLKTTEETSPNSPNQKYYTVKK